MDLQVGDKIVAISPCIMNDDGEAALVVGQEYTIERFEEDNGDDFLVITSVYPNHYFDLKKFKDFFRLPNKIYLGGE